MIDQFKKNTLEDLATIDIHGNGGTNKAKGGKATTSNDPSDPDFGFTAQERSANIFPNFNQLNYTNHSEYKLSNGVKILVDIPSVGDAIETTDTGIYIDNSPNQALWSGIPIFTDNSMPLAGKNITSVKPRTNTESSSLIGFLSPLGSEKDPKGQYNGMYPLPHTIGQTVNGVQKYFYTPYQNGGTRVMYANLGKTFKFFLNPKNADNKTVSVGDYVDFLRTNFPFVDKIASKTASWTGCLMKVKRVNEPLADAGGQQYGSDFIIVEVEIVGMQAPNSANRLQTLFV